MNVLACFELDGVLDCPRVKRVARRSIQLPDWEPVLISARPVAQTRATQLQVDELLSVTRYPKPFKIFCCGDMKDKTGVLNMLIRTANYERVVVYEQDYQTLLFYENILRASGVHRWTLYRVTEGLVNVHASTAVHV